MKNNKDLYSKANDEITADEKLKRITKNNILEKEKKKSGKFILKLANVSIIILLVFSLVWLNRENDSPVNEIDRIINPGSKIGSLPTVNNKEDLLAMLKKSSSSNKEYWSSDLGKVSDMAGAPGEAKSIAPQSQEMEMNNSMQDYSETNVQVEGVKEADIVKTDGEYIYYLSVNKLVIVDAKEPSNMNILTEIEYIQDEKNSLSIQEMFLNKDKLIVVGTKYEYGSMVPYNDLAREGEEGFIVDRIAPISSKTYTVAIVYDITNRQDIKEIRTVELEGSYLSSRMIGEDVYMMSNKYIYLPYNYKEEELKDEDILPIYRDTLEAEEKKALDYSHICYFPGNITENSYLLIAGFNVEENKPANIQSYLGAGSTIYSSTENLYVTKAKYTDTIIDQARAIIGMGSYEVSTEIYKFSLKNANVKYLANGSVPGTVLNQFSMDEYNGDFRIATTERGYRSDDNTNGLYILDKNLNQVGKVNNLAKGESIYSVRFMGDKGYIVTFRQVDPLFVIDLSNRTAPRVLGELKIPGYSEYLHPYDETHIIGFGRDTEVVNYGYGEQVLNQGMKMALFDVSDYSNPKELFSTVIGDRGTYSELLSNHKALLFSKEKDIIAFPIHVFENSGIYSSKYTFKGALVYGLDLEKGFNLRGQITHSSGVEQSYNSLRDVERIIYIGDTLFTLSKELIKATDLNTMNEIGTKEIPVKNDWYNKILY